jgi:hypothetical protein
MEVRVPDEAGLFGSGQQTVRKMPLKSVWYPIK